MCLISVIFFIAIAFTVENFIDNWNGDFPKFPLTTPDLKNSHVVMGALFQVFDRLGIDLDTVLAVRYFILYLYSHKVLLY